MMTVWVFMGAGASFPAAVFEERSTAKSWAEKNGVSGVFTEYPVGISVLEWVQSKGLIDVEREKYKSPVVIQRFSSAYQGHFHVENGKEI